MIISLMKIVSLQWGDTHTKFLTLLEMKIKDLIKELKDIEKQYPDCQVIASSDSEGNSYHDIDEVAPIYGSDHIVCLYPSHDWITV